MKRTQVRSCPSQNRPLQRRWSRVVTSLLATLAWVWALPCPTPVHAAPALRVQGAQFVDDRGGVVILRGVNLAGDSKVPPFAHVRSLADLDPLPGWGVNAIRLIFNWEAYEPLPGMYDDAYLSSVTSIADAAWARGMYVIIDIHQDAYSRYTTSGCGDGFPRWAVSPAVRASTPDNGAACANWGMRMMLAADMHRSFSDFYADRHGVRTRYLQLMSRLAHHFRGHRGVIGFDPLNEPWGDEVRELSPLYHDVARVVRAELPDAILFLEGHVLTNGGFLGSALPKPTFDNYAYAPHYYDAGVLLGHSYSGISTGADIAFALMTQKAQALGAPLLLGEYGAPAGTHRADDYLTLLHRHLNRALASGTQWNYTPRWDATTKDGWNREDLSIVDDHGKLRDGLFRPRAYAQRIAGQPVSLTVREGSALIPRAIELRWQNDPALGDTVLFAPRVLFDGPTAAERAKIETQGDGLLCAYDRAGLRVRCLGLLKGERRITVRACLKVGSLCL